MKTLTFYSATCLLAATLFITSCKKEKQNEVQDTDTQTAQDNSLAEETFNDVNNIANQAVENGSLSTYRLSENPNGILSSCATVTITPDTAGTGGTVVVDFGSTPCFCNDYRFRKGIINISYTGMYRDSGTVIEITFDNYYVGRDTSNMYKVTGTKTVTNRGHNTAGHTWFSIHVNGNLLKSSGQVLTWNSDRQREWTAGESTTGLLQWGDDEYMITGSVNGTGFNGNSFTLTITQALHVALNCRWIKDGKFSLDISGKPTRFVDYGSGSCDNDATVTINGFVFNITLP